MKKTFLPLSFVLSSVFLAGCALNTQNFSTPEQIVKREANMSSAIFADDGITTIKIPNLKMESDTQNDTFPKAKIPTFDITESGLVPALSKIAKRAGITLTIKGSFSDALSGSATIENLGGDIQNVLDKLANTYGILRLPLMDRTQLPKRLSWALYHFHQNTTCPAQSTT